MGLAVLHDVLISSMKYGQYTPKHHYKYSHS